MSLFILKADNSKEMESISKNLSEKKFNVIDQQDNFILMKRKKYGHLFVHAVFLIIALFFLSLAIFANVIYFAYSYIWSSPNVLITTETVDDEGNPLEYNTIDEIMEKAESIL